MKETLRIFSSNKLAMLSLLFILFFVALAVFSPLIAPYDPVQPDLENRLNPPALVRESDSQYILGTDSLGRDILSRIIYGSRVSLSVGFIVVAFTMLIGITMGSIAGYCGGWLDSAISRIVDVLLAFPFLIFALGMMAFLGPGLPNLILALSLKGWVEFYRLVRGEVLSIKENDYVLAARAMGIRPLTILISEILPNVIPSLIVLCVLQMANVIIAEASLSFLGIGVQPPAPSWGSMVNDGRPYVLTSWWISTFPGIAIFILVLSISLLGDGLRDAIDPRLKD